MSIQEVSCEISGKTLTIETGKLAKQADGSVLVKYGDTRVLVTACSAKEPKAGLDFFPLTVEYSEKFYSSGKIPGGFLRREGRPSSEATLAARMIDRPIRPLFPEGYRNETQVVATILSLDTEADAEVAATIGTSAALHISDIPFNGPTAGIRVGRIDGKLVFNPSWEDIQEGKSDLEIFVVGTQNAIMMIEGGAEEVPEGEVLDAILAAHEEIKKICAKIEDLRKACGREKRAFESPQLDAEVESKVKELAKADLERWVQTKKKEDRYGLADEIKKKVLETIVPESLKEENPEGAQEKEKHAKQALEDLKYDVMRSKILDESVRIDGRDLTTIRQIDCEAGILPRTHGSALFTRGETQVLASVTLGTSEDEQLIDSIYIKGNRRIMLHYNFPPFSVGEVGRMGGQSRREIGHGALAERSVKKILPEFDNFPYTIRMVCETLESNGSSSMGSVCSASMALMDAGVPVSKPVAGIAMGLIKDGEKVAILSDILGDEDHLGDMDFKVAGTKDGITGIQMDIKIEGVNREIMEKALKQAHEGRMHILGEMAKAIEAPRGDLSRFAPRITSITIPTDKIGIVIGPGGKMIKELIAETGCKIDINDDGKVNIASNDPESVKQAITKIEGLTAEAEVGKTYKGVVKKIVDFGAFVGILPNQDGLLHISEIAHERVNHVEDFFKEGDEVEVKVVDVDSHGKVRLSRKELLPLPEGYEPPPRGNGGDRGGRGGHGGGRDRGGRGGHGGGRDRDRGGRGRGGGGGRDRGRRSHA